MNSPWYENEYKKTSEKKYNKQRGKYTMACGNGVLGLGNFGGILGGACGGGCGGCGGGCGCGGDDKRIAVITAIRAIVANGDGSFDHVGNW